MYKETFVILMRLVATICIKMKPQNLIETAAHFCKAGNQVSSVEGAELLTPEQYNAPASAS